MSNIADELRRARERAGMTKKEADQTSGVGSSSFSYYERGKRIPSDDTIDKIADALPVDADKLKALAEAERERRDESRLTQSGYVDSRDSLEAWEGRVLAEAPAPAKFLCMSMRHWVDADSWVAVVSHERLAAAIDVDPDELPDIVQDAVAAGFLDRPGDNSDVRWVFRLSFPE